MSGIVRDPTELLDEVIAVCGLQSAWRIARWLVIRKWNHHLDINIIDEHGYYREEQ